MLVTVQTITDSAIDLADMRNSNFIDQSGNAGTELIRYINIAYKDLYNQIVKANERHFLSTYDFNVSGSTDTYALPADFYKLLGVDIQIDGQGHYLTLQPFMFKDRNKYRMSAFLPISPLGYMLRYILAGNNIKFVPTPYNTQSIQLWYVPQPVLITNLAQQIEVAVGGGDEYISLSIAIMMLGKEESNTQVFETKRALVLQQILNMVRERDQGAPKYVVDEDSINAGALFPGQGFFNGY